MEDITKLMIGVGGAALLVGGGMALGMALRESSPQRRLPRGGTLPMNPSSALRQPRSRLLVLAPPYGRITTTESSGVVSLLERLQPGPLGIAIHALGGYSTAVDHIARALKAYPHKITAFVPYRAMSGGTLVALAADEIVMNRNAVLGPVDPQLAGYPAHSIATLLETKPIERMKEEWFVLGLESKKALAETTRLVRELVTSPAAITRLTSGKTTHGHAIPMQEAMELGLPIREGVPQDVTAAIDQAIAFSRSQELPFPY